ncbi:MAG TPA: hypothetical protein PKX55_20600, partial [Leptospiraceae bacterium]|nr:hypothetical protein [Leptospiraceae bacterium]
FIKFIFILILATSCSLNSNHSANSKVFYSDKQNPHAKMQLPLMISWSHDKADNANQPISVQIAANALSDLTNVTIKLTLSPDLKLVSGETSKTISTMSAGSTTELNLTVIPLKEGSFDINILLNGLMNGESIGSARTIRLDTSSNNTKKTEEQPDPSGLYIIPGKTEYGK